MELKPSNIFYSHDTIMYRFKKRSRRDHERQIGSTLDMLCEGRCWISDIPKIRVVKKNGKWHTLDNRRLWVFHHLEAYRNSKGESTIIPVEVEEYSDSYERRFSTKNGGVSIKVVDGEPGGVWYKKFSPVIPQVEENRVEQSAPNVVLTPPVTTAITAVEIAPTDNSTVTTEDILQSDAIAVTADVISSNNIRADTHTEKIFTDTGAVAVDLITLNEATAVPDDDIVCTDAIAVTTDIYARKDATVAVADAIAPTDDGKDSVDEFAPSDASTDNAIEIVPNDANTVPVYEIAPTTASSVTAYGLLASAEINAIKADHQSDKSGSTSDEDRVMTDPIVASSPANSRSVGIAYAATVEFSKLSETTVIINDDSEQTDISLPTIKKGESLSELDKASDVIVSVGNQTRKRGLALPENDINFSVDDVTTKRLKPKHE